MAAGGLFVAGGGAYYMSQIGTVKQLEKEHDVLATKTFVAKGKFKRAESDILESESLIKALQQQTDLDMRAITAISQELEAAKLKVQQLEAQQQQKEADVQRMRADVVKAQQQRDQARSDIEKFRKEAALAEKALAALDEQVAAARKQLNPLNHPLVRDFYKR
ncbi:hypothetical protein OEZ86_007867 [Tetradesmus obliquus]|uniref:Uncharacterized protein n=1 Tax=Tetradesmus obliquus TaxID=3088 RepID=A0A383VSY6_TETOB|nr:hypothetical protein OEZ86_007867 [Tetradesmus obliquus]|eukprot:jgi/Sobl393_1/10973/SZX68023.1